MTMRTWLLACLSLLIVAAGLAVPFVPLAATPFDGTPTPDAQAFVIHPSSLGLPMPAGLQA